MSFLSEPRQFKSLDQFEAYVGTLMWSKGWHPAFITGHNTGIPDQRTYLGWSVEKRLAWPNNLNNYYRHMKPTPWHAGPHLALCPLVDGGGIWLLCDLEEDGISVSCWNRKTIGIEMLADYATEDPNSGHGAEVRDLFVGVASILSNRLGWRPRPQVLGVSGIHWHHQCAHDRHSCPGKRWDGDDVIARIEAKMGIAPAKPPKLLNTASTGAHQPSDHAYDSRWLQDALNAAGADPKLKVDGVIGPKSLAAIRAFKAAHGLDKSSAVDKATGEALEAVLVPRRPVPMQQGAA